jgi:anti-sigma B factor antagonist
MYDRRLRVESLTLDGIPMLHLNGEVDLYTVPAFEQAISGAIADGTTVLVVDLTEISYLDSSGLSALIVAYKKLAAQGGDLYVVASKDPPAVRRVLEITRVDSFIRVRRTIDDVREELSLPRAESGGPTF